MARSSRSLTESSVTGLPNHIPSRAHIDSDELWWKMFSVIAIGRQMRKGSMAEASHHAFPD